MTISQHDLHSRPGPVYRALADALGQAIAEGRLSPGERLLPQRELAWKLKVTVGTVSRAYDLLIKRSLARGEVGRGTFVLDSGVGEALAAASRTGVDLDEAGKRGVIDLSVNHPIQGCMPASLPRLIAEIAGPGTIETLLGSYHSAAGLAAHREAAASWLRDIGVADAESGDVLFTGGAQGGLTTALSSLGRAGDPILCEALTYNGIRRVIARLGMHPQPVAIDEQGMVGDSLIRAIEQSGARVVVLSARLCNPTLATMSAERRGEIAAITRHFDLMVIEDDVYGPLARHRAPPFVAEAPERTIHLTSISKFLAPGLRLGILRAPTRCFDGMTTAQADLDLGESSLAGEIFARAYSAGILEESVAAQRKVSTRRLALARKNLAGAAFRGEPEALHLWLVLPDAWTAGSFALSLAREGVVVASGERFHAGHGAPPLAVRVSLGPPRDDERLAVALQRIAGLLACTTQTGTPLV